jgi:predicted transcriptional regulator
MKRLLIVLLFFISTSACLQAQSDKHEDLKALKTAFITQELDLSPKEAEKFWPIYNVYDEKIYNLKVVSHNEGKNKIKKKGGFDAISEKEADDFLTSLIAYEEEELIAKKELIKQLKKVISSKKILQLQRAERDFNRKLLREYHNKGRQQGQGKNMP